MIFVDDCLHQKIHGVRKRIPLPPAKWLGSCFLVIISNERFSDVVAAADAPMQDEIESVQNVHWLRLVLDEGHILGHGGDNHARALLKRLQAKYRWLLSGTPNPADFATGLTPFARLFEFIGGPCNAGRGIFVPADAAFSRRLLRTPLLKERDAGAAFSLLKLMDHVMMHHCKSSLPELVALKPQYEVHSVSKIARGIGQRCNKFGRDFKFLLYLDVDV